MPRLYQHKNGIWYYYLNNKEKKSLRTKDSIEAQEKYNKLVEKYMEEKEKIILNKLLDKLPPIDDYDDSNFISQKEKEGYIYFVEGESNKYIKIGFATNLKYRISQLQNSSPVELKILVTIKGNMRDEEKLHNKFAKYRKHGEWFEPDKELLDFINDILEQKDL